MKKHCEKLSKFILPFLGIILSSFFVKAEKMVLEVFARSFIFDIDKMPNIKEAEAREITEQNLREWINERKEVEGKHIEINLVKADLETLKTVLACILCYSEDINGKANGEIKKRFDKIAKWYKNNYLKEDENKDGQEEQVNDNKDDLYGLYARYARLLKSGNDENSVDNEQPELVDIAIEREKFSVDLSKPIIVDVGEIIEYSVKLNKNLNKKLNEKFEKWKTSNDKLESSEIYIDLKEWADQSITKKETGEKILDVDTQIKVLCKLFFEGKAPVNYFVLKRSVIQYIFGKGKTVINATSKNVEEKEGALHLWARACLFGDDDKMSLHYILTNNLSTLRVNQINIILGELSWWFDSDKNKGLKDKLEKLDITINEEKFSVDLSKPIKVKVDGKEHFVKLNEKLKISNDKLKSSKIDIDLKEWAKQSITKKETGEKVLDVNTQSKILCKLAYKGYDVNKWLENYLMDINKLKEEWLNGNDNDVALWVKMCMNGESAFGVAGSIFGYDLEELNIEQIKTILKELDWWFDSEDEYRQRQNIKTQVEARKAELEKNIVKYHIDEQDIVVDLNKFFPYLNKFDFPKKFVEEVDMKSLVNVDNEKTRLKTLIRLFYDKNFSDYSNILTDILTYIKAWCIKNANLDGNLNVTDGDMVLWEKAGLCDDSDVRGLYYLLTRNLNTLTLDQIKIILDELSWWFDSDEKKDLKAEVEARKRLSDILTYIKDWCIKNANPDGNLNVTDGYMVLRGKAGLCDDSDVRGLYYLLTRNLNTLTLNQINIILDELDRWFESDNHKGLKAKVEARKRLSNLLTDILTYIKARCIIKAWCIKNAHPDENLNVTDGDMVLWGKAGLCGDSDVKGLYYLLTRNLNTLTLDQINIILDELDWWFESDNHKGLKAKVEARKDKPSRMLAGENVVDITIDGEVFSVDLSVPITVVVDNVKYNGSLTSSDDWKSCDVSETSAIDVKIDEWADKSITKNGTEKTVLDKEIPTEILWELVVKQGYNVEVLEFGLRKKFSNAISDVTVNKAETELHLWLRAQESGDSKFSLEHQLKNNLEVFTKEQLDIVLRKFDYWFDNNDDSLALKANIEARKAELEKKPSEKKDEKIENDGKNSFSTILPENTIKVEEPIKPIAPAGSIKAKPESSVWLGEAIKSKEVDNPFIKSGNEKAQGPVEVVVTVGDMKKYAEKIDRRVKKALEDLMKFRSESDVLTESSYDFQYYKLAFAAIKRQKEAGAQNK